MQFPSKLFCLTLLLFMPDLVTPQKLQNGYKEKRQAVVKAHDRPNILFIITDDQGIGSDS